MSHFAATFLGVRGGLPVPGKDTVEFGGNTTCLQVRAGPHLIIIDSGTGIIGLGAELAAQRAQDHAPIVGTLLFTHSHHDHTQGFAFFAPLRISDSAFYVFGPESPGGGLRNVLQRAMRPSTFPVALDHLPGIRAIRHVRADQMILLMRKGMAPVLRDLHCSPGYTPPDTAKITIYHSSNHPKDGTFCYGIEYRGKRLVFASDTEGYEGGDRLLVQFARGADLLVHDAEYTDAEYVGQPSRQGWGHSTWRMAIEVGQMAGVQRLALTHHNARHNDAFLRRTEAEAQAVFPGVFFAREGTTVEL